MYTLPIAIFTKTQVRDDYNELTDELVLVAQCHAQRTEHGGRENLYASRIVHEQEVIYSFRWRGDIQTGMWVKDGERMRKILSIQQEGRRKVIHLKTAASDVKD